MNSQAHKRDLNQISSNPNGPHEYSVYNILSNWVFFSCSHNIFSRGTVYHKCLDQGNAWILPESPCSSFCLSTRSRLCALPLIRVQEARGAQLAASICSGFSLRCWNTTKSTGPQGPKVTVPWDDLGSSRMLLRCLQHACSSITWSFFPPADAAFRYTRCHVVRRVAATRLLIRNGTRWLCHWPPEMWSLEKENVAVALFTICITAPMHLAHNGEWLDISTATDSTWNHFSTVKIFG